MYGNQGVLTKAYKAAVQIAPYLIVKFTANEGEVTPGAPRRTRSSASRCRASRSRASAWTWFTRASRK
jgi:hypothetical protein